MVLIGQQRMNPEQRRLIVSTAEVTTRTALTTLEPWRCTRNFRVLGHSGLHSAAFDIEHTEYGEYCNTSASLMNQSDSDRIQELCSQIAVEQDRQTFLKLVQELNGLLSAKDGRLQNNEPIDRKDE